MPRSKTRAKPKRTCALVLSDGRHCPNLITAGHGAKFCCPAHKSMSDVARAKQTRGTLTSLAKEFAELFASDPEFRDTAWHNAPSVLEIYPTLGEAFASVDTLAGNVELVDLQAQPDDMAEWDDDEQSFREFAFDADEGSVAITYDRPMRDKFITLLALTDYEHDDIAWVPARASLAAVRYPDTRVYYADPPRPRGAITKRAKRICRERANHKRATDGASGRSSRYYRTDPDLTKI